MLGRARAFWMAKHRATRWSVGLLLAAAAVEPLPDSRWWSSVQLALLVAAIPLGFHGISRDRERTAAETADPAP